MNVEKRINELIDLINYHNEKYYNEDSSRNIMIWNMII